jgi:hypothetical protein
MKKPESKRLLQKNWREENEQSGIHTTGHCYIATESLFHLIGGLDSGYKPYCAAYREKGQKCTHWWLQNDQGHRLDPTRSQYGKELPPYHLGKKCGFLTGYQKISKRSQILIGLAK